MPLIKKDKHENDLDFAKPYPLTKGFFSLSKHTDININIYNILISNRYYLREVYGR